MINVTRPFLPPLEEYQKLLEGIWERNWLTNNGPLVEQLEKQLGSYLGVGNLALLANGTVALQVALNALGISREVITTPFSYVATVSSVVWEGVTPRFADIDPATFCIDPKRVEERITPDTEAIVATHVFGHPCDVEALDEIAARHNLYVIYDAAHAFGVKFKGRPVLNYGTVSMLSFHATKLYHTVEGGALTSDDADLMQRVTWMRNFGHAGPGRFAGVGINGKLSEFHAAMGLVNLRYIELIRARRKSQYLHYLDHLADDRLQFQHIVPDAEINYSYFPVVFPSAEVTSAVVEALQDRGVSPRRYFYPVLSDLDYLDARPMPIAESISERILCLPLYHRLTDDTIDMICHTVRQAM